MAVKKDVNSEIVRLNKEAKEHDMSYGEYVAYLELGKEKRKKVLKKYFDQKKNDTK